eukprot:superscaffoldBa00002560_g14650
MSQFGDHATVSVYGRIRNVPLLELLAGQSPFPIPRQEDGERRKSEADINAFSSRNATLCLPACLDICPAPGHSKVVEGAHCGNNFKERTLTSLATRNTWTPTNASMSFSNSLRRSAEMSEVGQACHSWPVSGSHVQELASPATFCLPEQMVFVCDPFNTLEDREGQGMRRRVAGRQGGPRSERLGERRTDGKETTFCFFYSCVINVCPWNTHLDGGGMERSGNELKGRMLASSGRFWSLICDQAAGD